MTLFRNYWSVMKKHMIRNTIFLSAALLLLAGCAMGPRAQSIPGIGTDGEAIYTAYMQHVYKVDPKTGNELWRYPAEGSVQVVMYAPPLVAGDFVYFGDLAKRLVKLDAQTGQEIWTWQQAKGWYQAQVALANDLIIAPNTDGNVYAVSTDGQLVWTYRGEFGFIAAPVVVDDHVIIASQDHQLISLNLSDGAVSWALPMKGALVAAPHFDSNSGLLFAGSLGKDFVAVDAKTGELKWQFTEVEDVSSVWATPILIQDQLIFTDESGFVYSVQPETGKLNWKIGAGGSMLAGPLALEDSFVLALEDGTIKAYDLNQSPIWTQKVEGELYGAPVLAGDVIVVGAIQQANVLYAFDLKGNPLWSFVPEN